MGTEGFDYGPKRPDGQYERHPVLSETERAQGFVRPVRRSYRHVGARPKYETRPLTDAERERYPAMGYVAFESYPAVQAEPSSVVGRFWTAAQLASGCDTVTTMGLALAETYARQPTYYGRTFCAGCRDYFAVGPKGEFVWEGTEERVGS